jgi:hypothetical protein
VPADDVRVATDLIIALKQLDITAANAKWQELISRVLGYGTIEGTAVIDAMW